MDVKELRIGNYILGNYMDYGDFEDAEKQEICTVLSLDSVGVCEYSIWVEGESASVEHYDSFEGIELTEEWILKLGLSSYQDIKVKDYGFLCIESVNDEKVFYIMGNDNPTYSKMFKLNVKYVHQLQNLYFALTGQELTIKQ